MEATKTSTETGLRFIPITAGQKSYLLGMWHWEFWLWSENTKRFVELVKQDGISKYDASLIIDLSKTYLEIKESNALESLGTYHIKIEEEVNTILNKYL